MGKRVILRALPVLVWPTPPAGPYLRADPWQLRRSATPERALWAPDPPASSVRPTPSLLASCELHLPSASLPDKDDRLRGPPLQESCGPRVAIRHPHEEGPFWVPSASIINTVVIWI